MARSAGRRLFDRPDLLYCRRHNVEPSPHPLPCGEGDQVAASGLPESSPPLEGLDPAHRPSPVSAAQLVATTLVASLASPSRTCGERAATRNSPGTPSR